VNLRYTVSTVAPLFIVRPVRGVHVGVGPAFFATTLETESGTFGPTQSQTTRTGGLLWEVAATVPPRSRLFGEILAQYRQVGHVDAGPFMATNGLFTSTLPATRVDMNHWFLGVGIGVRF
jgi:hypothetical protein